MSKTSSKSSTEANSTSGAARVWGNVKATLTKINTDDLRADDVIIAVMGPTGAGKSSFISKAVDQGGVKVGHNLQSETYDVDVYRMSAPGVVDGDIVFVDTPGFDDTRRSDLEILKTVYERNILLSGILYLHRITDNRMAGTPLKNLHSFEKLVGRESLQKVILVSTMWDEIEEDLGSAREKDLKDNYWNYMISRGAGISRFKGDKQSAFELIQPLMDKANERHALRLQKEMVKLKKELPETSAGQELFSKLEFVLKERQDTALKFREAVKEGSSDVAQYEAEWKAAEEKLEAVLKDLQELKIPMLQRLITNIRAWLAR
ncbi:P-loop containing nucleoside triphosphate hydrolase protein [Panaeolus papilionaceus]|nr:P-loop containing nucleoside triphosphate hydrolase protein [Panaeolus papilionaceus]